MKALYHSLKAQGLSIALRDHGKELFLSQPGTYYLRYSATTPAFLTVEVKPPRTWFAWCGPGLNACMHAYTCGGWV
jgi:hypothetical protein